jgi:hypothetical protein
MDLLAREDPTGQESHVSFYLGGSSTLNPACDGRVLCVCGVCWGERESVSEMIVACE